MGQWVKVCGGSDLRPAVREWLSSFCAWDGSINSYAPPQQPTPRRTWGEREEPRAKTAGASGLPLPERPRLPGDEVLEAIGRDDPAALEALRGQGTDPCAPLPDGQTALAAAVRGNQAKSLTLLLRRGCDLDAVEAQSGRTPLMLATAARNVELARQLLVAGAAVTPVAPDGQDAWSLVGGGSDAVSLQLRTMLLAKGASVDAAAAQGSTLLMRASGAGSTALIDWLLSRGAKPDLADAEGRTALMHATLGRNAETVLPLLLGRGAAINARDQAGRTALGLTAEIGDRALRERLIRQLQAAGGKP